MGDLGSRLATPGARMLDVGTGVSAMAIAFAQVFPQLHVLGIDVLDRPAPTPEGAPGVTIGQKPA